MADVLIGIQARSGSTRLRNKANELIGGRTVLERVIDACEEAARHITRREALVVETVVLTPTDDPIASRYKNRVRIVEGPEQNVLARYGQAMEEIPAQWLIRITGDCPLHRGYVIDGTLKIALRHKMDYLTNADERFRTTMDGEDCEVISRRLFQWALGSAQNDYDKEHVTPILRRSPPDWAKVGALVNAVDHSSVKMSVDTAEDLERCRDMFERAQGKYREAIRVLGRGNVFRI